MIVLDTNAWIWWLHDPSRLTDSARAAVEKATAEEAARVSVISLWEVALKVSIDKLRLPMDLDTWWTRAKSYPGIGIEPITPADAIASTRLPGDFHRDPADRFIVALARRYGTTVVTSDAKIIAYSGVDTIW